MRFIRRGNVSNFTDDYEFTATIESVEYPVSVTGIAAPPDTAIEVELDDGSVVVLLGYLRK